MVGFINTFLYINSKYRQYSAAAHLFTSRITRTCYPFPGNGFITQKLSLQIAVKSSCHFVFSHSVLLCPNLCSTASNKVKVEARVTLQLAVYRQSVLASTP
jgi:hypothetical protein